MSAQPEPVPESQPVPQSGPVPPAGRRTGGVSSDVVLAVALLAVGVVLLWVAVTAMDGDTSLQGPRLAPVIVTGAWVIIAAFYLVGQLRPHPVAEPHPPVGEEPASSGEEPEPQPADDIGAQAEQRPGWRAPAGVLAALVGFAVLLEYAGFVVSAALFLVVTARVLGSRSLRRDLIIAVILPIAVYLGFTRLLDIFLPAGVFPL